LIIESGGARDDAYAKQWRQAESAVQDRLQAWMQGNEAPAFEGRVAWQLAQELPAGSALCVANSMPVRDIEYFWPADDRGLRVFFSRGANGIDGTLSTALGVAHRGEPTVLLTGDLAFLH